MKRKSLVSILLLLVFVAAIPAQIPLNVHLLIAKAEDARDAAPVIEMLTNVNAAVRARAALAVGRIGDDKALDGLIALLKDESVEVRTMAAFAIGEIESAKGSDAIVKLMDDAKTADAVRARAVEAAGKIAAANPRDARTKDLGDAVLDVLDAELAKGDKYHADTVRFGITSVLRARPNEGDVVVAKFLANKDARLRADAANTLTRLRSKNANAALRAIVTKDIDAVARAQAARALGAADDKGALSLLVDAATNDADSRLRVSAMRSLGGMKDTSVLDRLIQHGDKLLAAHKISKAANPPQKTELLELATALSQLFPNTENQRVVVFLNMLRMVDGFSSAETEIALARVAPRAYIDARLPDDFGYTDRWVASAYAQGLGTYATSTDKDLKQRAAEKLTRYINGMTTGVKPRYQSDMLKAIPDLQRANASFKPANLDENLRGLLTNKDVNVRATAAELLAAQPASVQNGDALRNALAWALENDKRENDAQLALMGALSRVAGRNSISAISAASYAPDYLVRRRAADILKQYPGWSDTGTAQNKEWLTRVSTLKNYDAKRGGTRLGQILLTDADYRRALSRKNGTVKAVFTTQKGAFTIDFNPEEAPLTVDNFVRLARVGYFNRAEVHRVVANFVMQDGDPSGTGSGGPGLSIRCEVNMLEYERGSVGMALSGKDTGGSQWFVTHSPQPHLDGGYTVFGRVNEKDMKVVDSIVRGDKIIRVRIIGR